MHRDEFRKIVADSVTRSLAQSAGSAPAISAEQLQSVVNGVADGVFAGLEASLPEDGIPNSINLTQPGAREAVAAAAASAASSAASAVLSGNLPAAGQVNVVPAAVTPAASPAAPSLITPAPAPAATYATPAATAPAVAAPAATPLTPPAAPPVSSTDAAAVAAVIAASSAAGRVPIVGGSAGEVLLWQGRPYLTIGTLYQLTSQRLRIVKGIGAQVIEEIELVRVRDTKTTQSMTERFFDIGDIEIVSTDATASLKFLYNVKDPVEVREMIRKAVVDERARRGLVYREEMHDHDPGFAP